MLRMIVIAVLAVLAAGCDPCAGFGSCAAPRVRYEGEVTRTTGPGAVPIPAETVSVRFVRTRGVELEVNTLTGRTDGDGKFLLEGRALGDGEVVGDLWIYPPSPVQPVKVPEVRMATTRAPGELRALGSWKVPYPYLGYQFYLYYRATGMPATGIEVEFQRTGGITIGTDTLRLKTDPRGFAILRTASVGSFGDLVGDFTFRLLPPRQPYVLRGQRLQTFTEARFDSVIPIGIGDRLPYVVILVAESTGMALPNADVEFRRTGGVQVYPERFTGRTNEGGGIRIGPVPFSSGVAVGDLIVRPAGSDQSFTIHDFRLSTIGDDRPDIFYGYIGVPGL